MPAPTEGAAMEVNGDQAETRVQEVKSAYGRPLDAQTRRQRGPESKIGLFLQFIRVRLWQ